MSRKPPYEITEKMVNLTASISALLTTVSPNVSMRLRKGRNIRSVHSSLAIENNTLSLEQVTDVINGRIAAGSPREILEVKNAFAAYSQIESFEPFSIRSFLKAHKLMMNRLEAKAGKFRSQGAGVYDGDRLARAAPQAEFVYEHVANLFAWAKGSEAHPLIKSSAVHYGLEFIRPFTGGNGRMGRLWQTVILGKWEPLFLSLPTETVIYERRKEYHAALGKSDRTGNSAAFIEFMLTAIAAVLALQEKHKDKRVTDTMISVLKALRTKSLSRKELFAAIGMSNDFRAFKRNIEPLITDGYIEMTLPDKPSSQLQKYRLTDKGKAI